jgi:ribonuclease PH
MTRLNERALDELRPIEIVPNFTKNPDGSVLIKCGQTMVLCTAMVEEKVPPFLRGTGSGWVTAEYSLLPASTETRVVREASKGKITGRTSEIQRLIGRSLRAVIDLKLLGERTIWVDCDVLQADGGTRTTAINGAFIAVALAMEKMLTNEVLTKLPIKDYLAAISVGIVKGIPHLDLEYAEDSQADVDMNIVMTGQGEFVEIQGTGEEAVFNKAELAQLLDLAEKGIKEVIERQKQLLGRDFNAE